MQKLTNINDIYKTTYNLDNVIYNNKKEKAFKLSRTNRKESDKLEKEANDILIKIEKLTKE